ncbi:MAG TPA: peroxiredoxin [Thermoanaerobaculia bacterium]|nr:peroxiredoxin [Thermoanaerobaculia bacterium]
MNRSDDLHTLPPDLPVPVDDGACDHLPGLPWPSVRLPSTGGTPVALDEVRADWLVVYCYPRTGLPDRDPPGGLEHWDAIPGARGCTPQSCSYRDHHAELRRLGCRVFGVSTQDPADQREAAERLHLPFELLHSRSATSPTRTRRASGASTRRRTGSRLQVRGRLGRPATGDPG